MNVNEFIQNLKNEIKNIVIELGFGDDSFEAVIEEPKDKSDQPSDENPDEKKTLFTLNETDGFTKVVADAKTESSARYQGSSGSVATPLASSRLHHEGSSGGSSFGGGSSIGSGPTNDRLRTVSTSQGSIASIQATASFSARGTINPSI